jgi:hypothetical protein
LLSDDGGTDGGDDGAACDDLDEDGICDDEDDCVGAYDCHGDCGGTAATDDCGVCAGGATGLVANADKDCNGDCSGIAAVDTCGVCAGGNTGLVADADVSGCDSVCFSTAVDDCSGTCGGTAVEDECGVCGGDGSSCSGDGGEVPTDGCELPENTVFLTDSGDVLYNVPTDFAGVQFTVDGTTASGASGGEAAGAGWILQASGSTVLGFSFSNTSISTDCGTLFTK